jgi:hypothetical protein
MAQKMCFISVLGFLLVSLAGLPLPWAYNEKERVYDAYNGHDAT